MVDEIQKLHGINNMIKLLYLIHIKPQEMCSSLLLNRHAIHNNLVSLQFHLFLL